MSARGVEARLFWAARSGEAVAGVMKFELEDAYFWPEVVPGTSAFVHTRAVRRAWAGQGVPAALLAFALERAQACSGTTSVCSRVHPPTSTFH